MDREPVYKYTKAGVNPNDYFAKPISQGELLAAIDKEARDRILANQWEEAVEERIDYLLDRQREHELHKRVRREEQNVDYDIPDGLE